LTRTKTEINPRPDAVADLPPFAELRRVAPFRRAAVLVSFVDVDHEAYRVLDVIAPPVRERAIGEPASPREPPKVCRMPGDPAATHRLFVPSAPLRSGYRVYELGRGADRRIHPEVLRAQFHEGTWRT
jgi:hypothetical protein